MPRKGDPRIPFALILTVYALMGVLWLGFNRSPIQILATVLSACLLDMALHWLLRKRELLFPLSAYITSLSLALILNYSHDYVLLFLPVFLAIGSKYLLTFRGSHMINPSLFGVAVSLLLAGSLISTAPAYQWGGTWAMSAFMVMAALSLFVFKVDRGWLVGSFLLFYTLQTALRAYIMRYHLPPEMLFLGTMSTPPFFLFSFFMITDPRTSPSSRRGQVAVAFLITTVDLFLHLLQSVFTFFYAAFIVQSLRFLLAHAWEGARAGIGIHLRRALANQRFARTVSVLTAIALVGVGAYTQILRPQVALHDVGYRFQELPPAQTGITVEMDPNTLNLVDPRIQHIGKWLLSVGSAVAVGDVTGSGRPDLFFTNPLAAPKDRNALYLNRGGFRFERVPVPALDAISDDPQTYGVVSGAIFFDYDGDGYPDLLLTVGFGRTILLRNLYPKTGRVEFEDVSHQAGIDDYSISVAANILDYDRDGHPDILLANVMDPYLRDYPTPRPLSIFRLPEPEYPGDRRMFHFMHNSWHNADNGGGYVLYRNTGQGGFEKMDAAALGLRETHWSLSVGTGDLNGSGWTDLYVANDFGPDDLYINDHGRFHRVAGPLFGDVGKDTYKGMNSSLADLERTGRLDVYVSDVHHALQAEGSLLWMNHGVDRRGDPILRDEATARGALNEERFGWGAGVGDLGNRGWLDIVQANGHIDDSLDRRYAHCPDYWYINHKLMQSGPEIHTYADQWGDLRGACIFPNEKPRIYYNRGPEARPQFVDVAASAGLTRGNNSRAVALADLDNTGRLDIIMTNQFGPPTILRNLPSDTEKGRVHNAWIGLNLAGNGITCNRDALGSTVKVQIPGERVQMREVQAVTGFSAQSDRRVHFGLGKRPPEPIDIAVRWCGQETISYRLLPDRYHSIAQRIP